MKIKDGYKLCNFQLPNDLYEYLLEQSKREYMNMTQYIIHLLKEDIRNKVKEK